MKKSRKKSKINIARLLLFISVIILWILGNNIYSNVRRFSWAEIAKANFLQTESYKSAITHEIETLEDAIYWSIWNDELESYPGLEYINRENSNIEYIADITTNTGKHIILSNLKTVIQDKEHIKSEFKESLQYYICSLNSVPDTNIDVLQKYGFKADQSRFEVLDIYVKVNLDNNGYMKTIQQNYYKANHNIKINIIGVVIFSILSKSFILSIYSLYTSFVSPLREDSSTDNFPFINIPSAGTLLPGANISMSFFTISSIVISLVLPSLFTKTFILEDSSCIL